MSILFNSKLNTGSLNSLTSNGTSSGSPVFVQTEKGFAIELSSGKSVSWTISSSNITNIVSFIKGIGTYRVTLNATNIDVSKTTFDYQFQNSSGTYNSITTVTITATSGTILVSKIALLNGTEQVNQLQAEYYNAQPVGTSKRGFVLDKPTDLSPYVGSGASQGLVAGYNMIKNRQTLVDISGNGYNGTIDPGIFSTKEGLMLDSIGGSNRKITISPTITSMTTWSVSFRIKRKYDVSVHYFGIIGGTNALIYHRDSGKICWYDSTYRAFNVEIPTEEFATYTVTSTGSAMSIYLNGVFQNTITSPSSYAFAPNNIGSAFSANWGFALQDMRIYNRVLSTAEISAYHNSFVLPTLVENFSCCGADGVTKTDAPSREWERVSGTWKISEITTPDTVLPTITKGTKYLENVSSGVIGIPSNTAYGSWEFDWFKGADANTFALAIVNNKNLTWGGDLGGSYWFQVSSTESLRLLKGNVSDIMNTANSYIANNTWYRVRITRTITGSFTMLIKGGAFIPTAGYDGWTLVSVSGGSGTNPVIDTTTTTSNYLVIQASTGDRVANIVIRDGIKV